MYTRPHPQPSTTPAERRQHPRVKLTEKLVVQRMGSDETAPVEEVSAGGFSVVTQMVFEQGSQHRFRLSNESGLSTEIEAVCRYVRPTGRRGEGTEYLVGFQFVPQPTSRLRVVLGAIAAESA